MRRHPWILAVVIGLVFGWVAGAGVALLSDDTSSLGNGSGGGSATAEWVVGIVAAIVATTVVGLGLTRASARGLLDGPRRMAGGVGQESATANPDPQPDPPASGIDRSKTTP